MADTAKVEETQEVNEVKEVKETPRSTAEADFTKYKVIYWFYIAFARELTICRDVFNGWICPPIDRS